MAEEARIGLDDPVFRGRLRQSAESSDVHARITRPVSTTNPVSTAVIPPVADRAVTADRAIVADEAIATTVSIIEPQPFARPALPRLQSSRVLRRQLGLDKPRPRQRGKKRSFGLPATKMRTVLTGMALLIFGLGLLVDIQTLQTNHSAGAQVSALAKQSDNGDTSGSTSVPSTTKPSAQAVSDYIVAPDLPRYIMIPKLGVDARVMQVGVTSSGALGTPNNVYDTAWYTGSAEPGQPGAMLIDGHVSSWTAHGVFYGLHTLVAGDKIQVERGDGTIFNYQVVKTQVYPSGKVDMQAAMTPIVAGKPGLNLITCTGQVIKGTSQFNERVIVFAEQI